MNMWLKRGLRLLGGLLVVIILGMLAIVTIVDPNRYREQVAAQVSDITGQGFTIDGDMGWTFWPKIGIKVEDIRLENHPDFGIEPMMHAGSVEASLLIAPLLKRQIEIGGVTLRKTAINLLTLPSGESNLDRLLAKTSNAPGSSSAEAAAPVQTGTIRLEEVQISLAEVGGSSADTLVIDSASLQQFSPDNAAAFELTGAITSGAETLLTDLDIRGQVIIPSTNEPVQFPEIALRAGVPGFSAPLDLNGSLNLEAGDNTRITIRDTELSFGFEPVQLNATLLAGPPATIQFTIKGDTLDTDEFLAGMHSEPSGDVDEAPASGPPDWLATTRINGNLELNTLVLAGLSFSEVDAQLTARNGVVSLAPLSGSVLGGKLTADLSADTRTIPALITLKPVLNDVDMGAATEYLLGTPMLAGRGNVSLELNGEGLDTDNILRTLGGGGSLELGAGTLYGVDVDRLLEAVMAMESLQSIKGAFGGETDFTSVVSNLTIENGGVSTPGLMVNAESFNLSGNGLLNLPDETLDYTMNIQLKEPFKSQLTERFPALASATLPVSISGSMASPGIGFDATQLLRNEAGQAIEEKKDELKDNLKRRLFERLSGSDDETEEEPKDAPEESGGP